MFDSISLASFLKVVLYVNAVLAIALASDLFGLMPPMPLVSQVSVSVIAVSALIFFVGQTSVFPWLCGLPGMWRVFPNIDAEYTVDISSNWSIIEARSVGRQARYVPRRGPGIVQPRGQGEDFSAARPNRHGPWPWMTDT